MTAKSQIEDLTIAPLTQQLQALLGALYRDCGGTAVLQAYSGIGSPNEGAHAPATIGSGQVSPWILQELAYVPPADVAACVATYDTADWRTRRLRDVQAVWAEIALPWAWNDRTKRHDLVKDAGTAALAPLRAFPFEPSFIIDQRRSLTAMWLLTEPLRLWGDADALARLEHLQLALAERVGGRRDEVRQRKPSAGFGDNPQHRLIPAWHPERFALRLPGGRAKDFNTHGDPVFLAAADLTRRISVSDLESALSTGSTSATTNVRNGRKKAER